MSVVIYGRAGRPMYVDAKQWLFEIDNRRLVGFHQATRDALMAVAGDSK